MKNLQNGFYGFTPSNDFKGGKMMNRKKDSSYCVLQKREVSYTCYLLAIPSLDKNAIIT